MEFMEAFIHIHKAFQQIQIALYHNSRARGGANEGHGHVPTPISSQRCNGKPIEKFEHIR